MAQRLHHAWPAARSALQDSFETTEPCAALCAALCLALSISCKAQATRFWPPALETQPAPHLLARPRFSTARMSLLAPRLSALLCAAWLSEPQAESKRPLRSLRLAGP